VTNSTASQGPAPFSDDGVASVVTGLRTRIVESLADVCLPGADSSAVVDALCGGKHLRARAVQLAGLALGTPDPEFATVAGIAVELLHTASLVHDDIIDESTTRRGHPTLHIAADGATAILVADLLIALSFETAAVLGRDAVGTLARSLRALCRGQLLEPTLGWDAHAQSGIEEYATLKTGALFGTAFELGAMASSRDVGVHRAFRASGERLGLAFQLCDDLLDVREDVDDLGKDHGMDLRNGIPTLPLWSAYRYLVDEAGETRAATDPTLRAALGREAVSHRTFDATRARIDAVVAESRTTMPPATQSAAFDCAVRTILESLGEFPLTVGPDTVIP
jgi:heptaprenyl diphosphate synthase